VFNGHQNRQKWGNMGKNGGNIGKNLENPKIFVEIADFPLTSEGLKTHCNQRQGS
jgi:hypothetical protein